MDIVLFPATDRTGNELRIDRDEFNKRRVELVHACVPHLTDKLRFWTYRADNDVVCINFKRLPVITDSQYIQKLMERDLIGAYWFINRSDTSGQLSIGQIWDLQNTLLRVHETLSWPEQFCSEFKALLDKCMTMMSALQFGSEERNNNDLLAHLKRLARGSIKDRVCEAVRSNSREEYVPQ